MLKFFRQIRQRLLNENRFSKYLLYAVGEILLVVMGILIALQVNNWNLAREDLKYQDTVLDEIKKSLESDIGRYQENLETLMRMDSGVTGIVNLMETDTSKFDMRKFYESANKTVLKVSFEYNAGAYEGLKSTGLEKIQNTRLRSDIINYYEITLKAVQKEFQEENDFFEQQQAEIRTTFNEEKVIESIFVPHQDSLVRIGLNINPQKILSHRLYPKYLKNVMWKSSGHRKQLNDLIDETKALIRSIDNELDLQ